jgi:hypothetical protein
MRYTVYLLLCLLLIGCTLPDVAPAPPSSPTVPSLATLPSPTLPSLIAPPPPALLPTPPPPTVTPRPFDRETIATAPVLALDAPQPIQLTPEEVAWFRVELQAGQAYELLTTNQAADTAITLFSSAGKQAAHNDNAEGLASRIIYVPAESGTMYVRVDVDNVSSSLSDSSCVLLLRTLTLPPPDAFEPDDTIAQAKLAQLDVVQDRSLTHPNDVDWAVFRTQPGQIYLFRTSGLDEDVDVTLTIFDERVNTPGFNADIDSELTEIVYRSNRAETLYVRLAAFTRPYAAPQLDIRYQFVVSHAPVDAFEPDDTMAQARLAQLDVVQDRSFTDIDDIDWVAFRTQPGQTYIFRTFDLDEWLGYTRLTLLNEQGSVLAFNDYTDSSNREMALAFVYRSDQAETLYVRLEWQIRREAPLPQFNILYRFVVSLATHGSP